eukprot:1933772-Prymnesium_polylepis.1
MRRTYAAAHSAAGTVFASGSPALTAVSWTRAGEIAFRRMPRGTSRPAFRTKASRPALLVAMP